ncbi:hypothetical protein [uncultured Hydrogenophaga sp.]|uniref:hypothetical protein n=1 Tax=uncultured Hydrogenophaga sp. TaxID=199683 RepID=UPI00265F59C8|nr:hypothetical protein [uncultured Hydrogenophaga sp.]
MRIFWVIVALLVLPLQLSAASAGQCCTAAHSGAVAQAEVSEAAAAPACSDTACAVDNHMPCNGTGAECSTCHAHGAVAVFVAALLHGAVSGVGPLDAVSQVHLTSWHERPYRPDWSIPERSGFAPAG